MFHIPEDEQRGFKNFVATYGATEVLELLALTATEQHDDLAAEILAEAVIKLRMKN